MTRFLTLAERGHASMSYKACVRNAVLHDAEMHETFPDPCGQLLFLL
jgi:hypothetical protein